jgi:hypothetical protein
MKTIRNICALAVLAGALLWIGSGCARRTANEEEWLARGSEILQPFKADLKAALMEGLQKGPEDAIAVCQVQAPMISERIGEKGVEAGRTSHKLRNPANKPRPWVALLLNVYAGEETITAPRVVALDDDRIGYVEPIYVQAPCLMCHGSSIADDVAAAIDRWYPEDEARGFAEGDFRGLFWVEFPANP